MNRYAKSNFFIYSSANFLKGFLIRSYFILAQKPYNLKNLMKYLSGAKNKVKNIFTKLVKEEGTGVVVAKMLKDVNQVGEKVYKSDPDRVQRVYTSLVDTWERAIVKELDLDPKATWAFRAALHEKINNLPTSLLKSLSSSIDGRPILTKSNKIDKEVAKTLLESIQGHFLSVLEDAWETGASNLNIPNKFKGLIK